MTTKERMIAIRITEKIKQHPEYAKQIGLTVEEEGSKEIKKK